MDILTYYTKPSQQLSFLFNKPEESVNYKTVQETKKSSTDTVEISKGLQEIISSGFKLTNSNQVKENSNYIFEYNFSNSLIQVQSSGNYDIAANKGNINLVINLSSYLKDKSKKLSILPKEIKLELDFSFSEVHYKNEKNILEEPPDMLSIISGLLKKIDTVLKDGNSKNLNSVFESLKNILDSPDVSNEKYFKDLIDRIQAQLQNNKLQNNTSQVLYGSAELSDKTTDITYNGQNLKLSLSNIEADFRLVPQQA